MYSDVGYRFRTNILNVWDTWNPYDSLTKFYFFDFKFFNQDTYEVGEGHALIAEIYFRLEIDEIQHVR